MSDLQKALSIFEQKFGRIGNLKFLLASDMDLDTIAADFLAIAEDTRDGKIEFLESYPEPNLRAAA